MAMWFYQLSQQSWGPEQYRLEIWENERWRWPVGRISGEQRPKPGDRVAFFYAKSGGEEPGFYGWAIILRWDEKEPGFHFRPVAPSDQLKMHPWWDGKDGVVEQLVGEIRGQVPQGTLWPISQEQAGSISKGIAQWVGGRSA